MSSIHPQAWLFKPSQGSGRHAGTQAGPEQGRLIGPESAGVSTQLCLRAIVSSPFIAGSIIWLSWEICSILWNEYLRCRWKLQPLRNGCKVGGHGRRRRMKRGLLQNFFQRRFSEVFILWIISLLNIFSSFLLMFLLPVLAWPFPLQGHCASRAAREEEKGATCSDSTGLEEQCSGSTIDWPIQHGYNHHSLVSFTHFFKAAFNLSLCLPIHAFDVVMPFLHLLNIWSISLHTAKSSWSGFT